MEEEPFTFRWKDIVIFGRSVPDFAEHSQDVLIPLLYGHLAVVVVFALSLIWLLFGFTQLGQASFDNQKFRKIFTWLLTPSAVLTSLSGAYLYFVTMVTYNGDPNLTPRALAYCLMLVIYFTSMIYMLRAKEPKAIYAGLLSLAIIVSCGLLFWTYLGSYYG